MNKIVRCIAIVGVLAVGIVVGTNLFQNKTTIDPSAENRMEVQKMDLDNSVSITGKGVSDNVDYVFSDVSAPVQEINVHKGDHVNVGDVICTFDASDIILQRDSYAQLLEDFEKYNKLKTDNLNNDIVYQEDLLKKQIEQLDAAIKAAQAKYDEAVNDEQYFANMSSEVSAEAEQIKEELDSVNSEIGSISAEIEKFIQNDPDAEENADNFENEEGDEEEIAEEAETVPEIPYDMDHYNYLLERSSKLKDLYELALGKKEFYAAKQSESRSEALLLDSTIKTYNSEYAQYKAQYDYSGSMSVEMRDELISDSNTKDNYKQKIDELNKKIENSKVVAQKEGIITDIFASVGDYIMDNPICQIQDNGKMHFEGYLNPNKSELVTADNKILVSMAVNNYDMIDGSIISISDYYDPEKGGYKIEFTFDGIDDMGIYPGFEAAAKIIISQQKDAMVVPYDAIFEKDDKFYVRKVNTADGSYEDVEVEKGLETNYYIAVFSDKLSEHDIIMTAML